MSSRFVSAGSLDDQAADKDVAWSKAKEELEVSRKRKEEAHQEGGKTLYEVLQANKAAKQEAFEESIRLKNQLQSLNEEDADYLDSVAKAEREQKAASAREASEQLAAFRKQQEEAEKAALLGEQGSPVEEAETWVVGKKRKKGKQDKDFLKGVKLRRTSTTDKEGLVSSKPKGEVVKKEDNNKAASPSKDPPKPAPFKVTLLAGLLGGYSSDEDD